LEKNKKRNKAIGIFTGSSAGDDPVYREEAVRFGKLLAQKGWETVYGGGNVGLMGAFSQAAYQEGSRVTGVIPQAIADKVSHEAISELIVVPGMHERKKEIYERSTAFAALPGGIGTLDEFFEIFTWQQLGYHQKPVGLYNIQGFFDGLVHSLQSMADKGFVKAGHLENLIVESDPEILLDRLASEIPRQMSKW